ncbi:fumarate hydratase, partial [Candidatus Woesearchaeota archaeon]
LRPIDQPNPDKWAATLEHELYEDINSLGIGPIGLGGKFTTLAVKVNYAYRHPASYPVAVAFQCWAARRASALIHMNGHVDYLTHEVG